MRRNIIPLCLSFIYCGLGQIYNRQIIKGIDLIIVYTILLASYFGPIPWLRVIGPSLMPVMWSVGMVDAYLGDQAIFNRGKLWLSAIPGILISALVFYILYTQLLG